MAVREPYPTVRLRWVQRECIIEYGAQDGSSELEVRQVPILQQLWVVPREPSPERLDAWGEEWRDVPEEEETP